METIVTDIPAANVVSEPLFERMPSVASEDAGPSETIHDEPGSSSGKRVEEPLRMPFDDDSSDEYEFSSMKEMKRRMVVLEQDAIHKDAKIIQLGDTIVKKDQQIEQLQGDVRLLFNMKKSL
ncbi:hypothetical protein Hanom_Chr02g00145301 [Helianthus anomalus]